MGERFLEMQCMLSAACPRVPREIRTAAPDGGTRFDPFRGVAGGYDAGGDSDVFWLHIRPITGCIFSGNKEKRGQQKGTIPEKAIRY